MRRILNFGPLVALAVLVGCVNRTVPVKKHSAGRTPMPLPADQVALVNAETPVVVEPAPLPVETMRPQIPALRPYNQWTEQEIAADAIARIGAPAVPELRRSLRSPDPNVRLRAIDVLSRVGSDAEPAVPDLIQLLDDEDPRVRRAAARTLGRIGPAAAEAVPALMRSLLQPKPVAPESPE
jgi:hypothetical protein